MDDEIAIVGMSCRFAGASSPGQLWEMIQDGRSGHCRIPKRSFNPDAWYHPSRQRHGAISTTSGFFLDDVSHFDAPFFSVTAHEAAAMDPMQRLALEVAYESFENAGIPIEKLARSRTGVYSGVMTADYQEIAEGDLYRIGDHAATGTNRAILSNRISWFFDLTGPSLTLDTACSSGLYGLHLACQAIKAGECNQALVTGTNLILHPNLVSQYSSMRMIGPDGISHTFDESANGYGRGEGIAGVVVKRLKDALRDANVIRAVIRGTAANHDGKTTSMTIPSEDAQAALIRSTYKRAGLSLSQTCYFEAHGTGTPQGDPIEMRAIAQTLGKARRSVGPLYVGSVKTNVGHTEGAAGLAGLIKVVLCLESALIPAVTGLKKVNPELHLLDWNIELPRQNLSWPKAGPRRASVNSFGFGGANAHVILDDALHHLASCRLQGSHLTLPFPCSTFDSSFCISSIQSSPPPGESKRQLFVISANDQDGLARVASAYADFLAQGSCSSQGEAASMESLGHILATRRSQLDFRSYIVADTWINLVQALHREQALPRARVSPQKQVAFVFTGQGAQRPGMARELLPDPVFDASIRRSQKVMDGCGAGYDIRHMLMSATAETIGDPRYSQPLCTAIQIALVDLLHSWGITPAAVVGHSSGEVAAAYSAGVMSHEDAMYVAFYRGALSSEVALRSGTEGSMLAAGLSESDAASYLAASGCGDSVTIACINSPSSVTFSGPSKEVSTLHETLVLDGKFSRLLRTGVAYHSPQMAVITDDVKRVLSNLPQLLGRPKVPMYSSVTEDPVDFSGLDREYWMENILMPVRFAGALRNLITGSTGETWNTEYNAILEIGPSKTLQGPIRQILSGINQRLAHKLPYRSTLVAGQHARQTALEAAGFLWATGHPVDIDKANGIPSEGVSLDMLPRLPSYPWNHDNSFWHETATSRAVRLRSQPRTDLLGVSVDGQNPFEPRWRNILSVSENPWLEDHNVDAACLFPAAGYLVMALEAVISLAADRDALEGVELTNVTFETGLALPEDGRGVEVSLSFRPHTHVDGMYHFTVYSDQPRDSVSRLVAGSVAIVYKSQTRNEFEEEAKQQEWAQMRDVMLDAQCLATKPIETQEFYSHLASVGLNYGPMFQGLQDIRVAPLSRASCGVLTVPDTKSVMPERFEYPHLLHPATLDSAFQLAFAALQSQEIMQQAAVPISVDRVFVSADMPSGAGQTFSGTSSVRRLGQSIVANMLFTDVTASGPKIVVESMKMCDIDGGSSSSEQTATASTRRSADIVWKEDVTYMKALATMKSHTWLDSWLDCFLHKYADVNILFLGAKHQESLIAVVQSKLRSEQRPAHCTLVVPDADQQVPESPDGAVHTLSLAASSSSEAVQEKIEALGSYDLVIVCGCGQADWMIPLMPRILKPEARLVILEASDHNVSKTSLGWMIYQDYHLLEEIVQNDFAYLIASFSKPTSLVSAPSVWKQKGITIFEQSLTEQTPSQRYIRESLCECLMMAGIAVKVACWGDHPSIHNASVISLVEYGQPLIYHAGEDDLAYFQHLVSSAEYVLWITTGSLVDPDENGIKYAATTGLLRTVRAEYPQLTVPHLDLSSDDQQRIDTVSIISEILCKTLPALNTKSGLIETEIFERDGKLLIPRLLPDAVMDAEIALNIQQPATIDVKLEDIYQSLSLQVSTAGAIQWASVSDSFDVDNDTAAEADTVLITTSYATITRPSKIQEASSSSSSLSNGWNAVQTIGSVDEIGHYVTDYQPGDLVVCLRAAPIQTRFREDTNNLLKLPSNISPIQAAYWIGPLAMAYHILGQLVVPISNSVEESEDRLSLNTISTGQDSPPESPPIFPQKDGQTVLIDIGDATLRRALLQVAEWLNLESFAIVPEGEESHVSSRCTVLSRFSRSISWMIRNQTCRGGIELVLSDLPNASNLSHILSSLVPQGRFITIDANADLQRAIRSLTLRQDINIVPLSSSEINSASMHGAQKAVVELLERNTTALPVPPSSSQHSISRLGSVLQTLHIGPSSIVLSFEPSSLIPVQPTAPLPVQLNSTGTYIISGGLGGLGLKIVTWLCNDYGARHLIILSRSGNVPVLSEAAIKALIQRGCRCDVVRCDITSPVAVREIAIQAAANNWNIRGIIQSAMVLADSPLESMTFDKWTAATAPKIHGSWNLHQILGGELDFFILLSSVSGIIGNSAQANYSAGNTFEDALAAYRHQLGLPAVSLNLGLVSEAETVGSTVEFLHRFPHLAPVVVNMREVKAALGLAIRGEGLNGRSLPHQIVVGISDHIQRPDDGLFSRWPFDPKFEHRVDRTVASALNERISYAKAIRHAVSDEDARLVIEDALRMKVASAIATDTCNIDVEKPITAYGIDSLKATEVRNWVLKEFQSLLSIFEVLSPVSISQLAMTILNKSSLKKPAAENVENY